MKFFNSTVRRLVAPACAAVLVFGSCAAWSQIPGSDKATAGMNSAMIKYFGANTNFICKAEARVLDKSRHETTSMPMGFQMLGDKMRMDINMADVKSKDMSPEFATTMRQMGMDQMITILLPDKQTVVSIYPGLKSYAETPMTKDEVDAVGYAYTMDKKRVGKETIDGHSCEKIEVTLTDTKGGKQKAVIWSAKDLNDFPVQMEIPADDSTLVMRFKDVKLGLPDASHFEPPAGMTKFDNIGALITDAAAKRAAGESPK